MKSYKLFPFVKMAEKDSGLSIILNSSMTCRKNEENDFLYIGKIAKLKFPELETCRMCT